MSWRIEPQFELNSIVQSSEHFRRYSMHDARRLDAGETQPRALTDVGETRFARVFDAVFDKLFLGSTVCVHLPTMQMCIEECPAICRSVSHH